MNIQKNQTLFRSNPAMTVLCQPIGLILPLLILLLAATRAAAEAILIDDFSNQDGWKVTQEPAAIEACEGEEAGNSAMRVRMPGMIRKNYGTYWFKGSENLEMDDVEGISFKVKGDGSSQFSYINANDRYGYSYVFAFPLKNTEWHTVYVRWQDFIPQGEFESINDSKTALVPSALTHFQFGTGWKIGHNNQNLPACEFCVDDLKFERKITPAPSADKGFLPLSEVIAKLQARKAVRILCMGDSITVGVGLKDMEKSHFATLLEDILRKKFGYPEISSESRAVGGSDTVWARTWLPRDLDGINPDLIIIHFGYNDKSRKFSKKFFRQSLEDYLDRIGDLTKGKTSIILMSTMPGLGPRFNMLDDFAEEVKQVAEDRHLTCLDLHKTFKNIGKNELRQWLADLAHPNEKGHLLIAQQIAELFPAK